MANESELNLVKKATAAANRILKKPLRAKQSAVLLYQVTVDNKLSLTVKIEKPVRGNSAFETDLCIFEDKEVEVEGGKRKVVSIPRVVMEFKKGITTHDVLTYSAKARKHKQVYPYLRYGVVVSNEALVPGRVFTHNEALDFCATIKGERLGAILKELLTEEVKYSRCLEEIYFGEPRTYLFRTVPVLERRSDDGGH